MKEHKKRSRQGCPLIEDLVMDEVVVVVVTRKRIRLLKKSPEMNINKSQQVMRGKEESAAQAVIN